VDPMLAAFTLHVVPKAQQRLSNRKVARSSRSALERSLKIFFRHVMQNSCNYSTCMKVDGYELDHKLIYMLCA
jgi:hypothetical protein